MGLNQALNQATASVQKATTSMKTLGPAIQGTTQQFNATVKNTNLASGAVMNFGKSVDDAGKKTASFGEKFSNNRGIVFGIAGLSSALAEAVGMLSMYGDAASGFAEAQAHVNQLQQDGITSGKEYNDAIQEQTKQQRWLNIVTRNTGLSLMDNVFFLTMVISGFQKTGLTISKFTGILSKVPTMFTSLGSSAQTLGGALPSINVGAMKASTGVTAFSKGLTAANTLMPVTASTTSKLSGVMTGIVGPIALVVGGLAALYLGLKGASDIAAVANDVFGESTVKISLLQKTYLELLVATGRASEEQKKQLEDFKKQDDIMIQAMNELGISAGALALNWDGAAEKIAQRMRDIVAESKVTVEQIKQATKADLMKDFNTEQLNYAKNVKEATPYALAFANAILSSNQPIKEQIGLMEKSLEQAVTDKTLRKEVADEIIRLVNIGLDPYIKKQEEVSKVTSNVVTDLATLKTAFAGLTEGKDVLRSFVNDPSIGTSFEELLEKSKEQIAGFTTTATIMFKDYHARLAMDSSLTVEAYLGAFKDLPPEISKIFMDLIEKEKDWQKQTHDMIMSTVDSVLGLADSYDAQKAAFQELMKTASGYVEVGNMQQKQMEAMVEIGNATTGAIQEQSKALTDNATFWSIITDAEVNETNAAFKNIQAWATKNDMVQENIAWQFELKKAYTEGLVGAKQETAAMLAGAVEAEGFRNNFIALNATLLQGVDVTTMETDELKSLAEQLVQTTDNTIALKKAQDEAIVNMKGQFSDLLTAEDNKAFKEAWKDLDLGDVPKNLRDNFKDLFKELNKVTEEGMEASTALGMVGIAAQNSFGELDWDDLTDTFKNASTEIENLVKKTGDMEGKQVFEKFLEPLQKMKDEDLGKHLQKIPATIDAISQAFADGDVTIEEYNSVMAKNAIETGKLKGLSANQIEILNDLGYSYNAATGEVEKNTDATTGQINPQDKLARQLVQITKNENTLKAAIDAVTGAFELQKSYVDSLNESLLVMNLLMAGFGGGNNNGNGLTKVSGVPGSDEPIPFNESRADEDDTATGGKSVEDANAIKEAYTDMWTKVTEIFKSIEVAAQNSFAVVVQNAVDSSQGIINEFTTMWESLVGIFNSIGTWWSENVDVLKELSAVAAGGIIESFTTMWETLVGIFNSIGTWWSKNVDVLIELSATASEGMVANFTSMWETVVGIFNSLGTWFQKNSKVIQKEASACANGIIKNMTSMWNKCITIFKSLATNFANNMKKMVSSSKSAVSSILSQINKLNTTVTTTHVIETVTKKAKGGIDSAASGKITTFHGPTLVGDNPGGNETVAYIPHNDPWSILEPLLGMFSGQGGAGISGRSTGGSGGFGRDMVVPITINIGDQHLTFQKKYRIRQGTEIASEVY